MANTIRMEDLLNQNADTVDIKQEVEENDKLKNTKKDKSNKESKTNIIPRGRPKSGRIWKNEKTKFSSIIKTKGIRDKFEKKQKLREQLKRVKEASRAIVEGKKQEKEQKKQRRRDNIKRTEENRKKSEVVQVITNTSKLKRMKKKHLRTIEKRDTLKI